MQFCVELNEIKIVKTSITNKHKYNGNLFFSLFGTLVVATQESYRTYDFFSSKQGQLNFISSCNTSLFQKEI